MTNTLDRLAEGYRSLDATVHDVDDKTHRVAVDFPIAIDSYSTDFGPSAFAEGWNRRLPTMDIDHNKRARIGEAVSGQSLSDCHRLVGRFDTTPRALHAFAGVRDGVYPGWSFHYVDGKTIPHPSGRRSALRFTKATMLAYGPVWAPSIPGTKVVGLRSDIATMPGDYLDTLDGDAQSATLRTIFDLQEHLAVAESQGDTARIAELKSKIAALIVEFVRTYGHLPPPHGDAVVENAPMSTRAQLDLALTNAEIDLRELRRLRDPAFRAREVATDVHRLSEKIVRERGWRAHGWFPSERARLIDGALKRLKGR